VAVGDTITLTYEDADDGTGSPATVTDDAAIIFVVDPGGDLYELSLLAGQRVTAWTQTPLDDPAMPSPNSLDPKLIVFDPSGGPLAFDEDSHDGKNAEVVFTAPEDGVYTFQVLAQSGEGEYLLELVPSDRPSVSFQAAASTAAEDGGAHAVVVVLHVPDGGALDLPVEVDVVDLLRAGRRTTWGLSRFSRRENGTVPFPNRQVIRRRPLNGTASSGSDDTALGSRPLPSPPVRRTATPARSSSTCSTTRTPRATRRSRWR